MYHGNYMYRLEKGRIQTDEQQGHSLFHAMAARLMDGRSVKDFLAKTITNSEYQLTHFNETIDTNQLIDDMRQSMTIFPVTMETIWVKNSGLAKHIEWQDFRVATAWKNPLEISQTIGVPFGFAYDLKRSDMHQVVWAAVCESHRSVLRRTLE